MDIISDFSNLIVQNYSMIALSARWIIVIILLIIAFPYSIYKMKKTNEQFQKLIYLVIMTIGASFAMIIILWDPNWGAPILTVGLLIVTFVYAQSSQKYVDLIETERKGKRIAEISRSIFSEMENLIDEIYAILDKGEYIQSISPFSSLLKDHFRPNRILKETILIRSEILDTTFNTNQEVGCCQAESMLRSGDDILKEYLPKIQKLCDNYDQNVHRIEELIEIITKKILIESDEFKLICDEFDVFHTRFKDEEYFDMLRYLLIPTQSIFYRAGYGIFTMVSLEEFIALYKPKLLEKLQRSSANRELAQYFEQISEIKTILKNLNETIENLMSDWKSKYNLLESEIRVRKMDAA